MPHSNPFQSNARSSSWYLLAQDEAHGELILDGIAAGVSVTEEPAESIEAELEGAEASHEEIQYVMIDDEMVGGKFSAITQWTGPEYATYVGEEDIEFQGQEQPLPVGNDGFEDTMVASLYLEDAEGMEHYRLVHENEQYSYVGGMLTEFGEQPHVSERLALFGWDEQAAQLDAQLRQGAATNQATEFLETVAWDGQLASSVKTFERVEGATISGEVDGDVADGETVYAQTELETEPGRTFIYTQQAEVEDGSFEMTVPYATDNELGPEDGATDVAVEALEDYAVFVGEPEDGEIEREFTGTTEVPETAVLDGETVEVTLEEGDGELVPDPDADPFAQLPDADEEDADEADADVDEDAENESETGDSLVPFDPLVALPSIGR